MAKNRSWVIVEPGATSTLTLDTPHASPHLARENLTFNFQDKLLKTPERTLLHRREEERMDGRATEDRDGWIQEQRGQ